MYLTQINGIIFGLVLIIFRKQVSVFIQKGFEKFPKYEEGVKDFNIKFTVQPLYVSILGSLILAVSIFGLFTII